MRYIKDIMLEKAILHVIDAQADEAILTKKELKINEEVEEFVKKHVIKSLNSDDTLPSRFLSDNVIVAKCIKNLIDDNNKFIEVSHELTTHLYNKIKNTDIPSGDVLFIQYIADEQRCFAILKLDYQLSHAHNITFEEDDLCIGLVSQEIGLPGVGKKLKKCAFFTKGPEDTIEIIVIDRPQKIEDGNEKYFIDDFLEAVIFSDDTDKTRRLKGTIEKWTNRNLCDQIEAATTVREIVNETLFSDEQVNINELSEQLFSEVPEIQASFNEHMIDSGYKQDVPFSIDKTYVEKKFKTKTIKTNTGIKIIGEIDVFKDAQKYVERKNGDGSIDIIIKNVRNVIEKA